MNQALPAYGIAPSAERLRWFLETQEIPRRRVQYVERPNVLLGVGSPFLVIATSGWEESRMVQEHPEILLENMLRDGLHLVAYEGFRELVLEFRFHNDQSTTIPAVEEVAGLLAQDRMAGYYVYGSQQAAALNLPAPSKPEERDLGHVGIEYVPPSRWRYSRQGEGAIRVYGGAIAEYAVLPYPTSIQRPSTTRRSNPVVISTAAGFSQQVKAIYRKMTLGRTLGRSPAMSDGYEPEETSWELPTWLEGDDDVEGDDA